MLALKEDRPLTTKEKKLCSTAVNFMLSPKGQKKVQKALANAARVNARLSELARIDPDIMNKPFTI